MSDWEAELDEPTPQNNQQQNNNDDDWENELEDTTKKVSTGNFFITFSDT